jgi:hypothetical protein
VINLGSILVGNATLVVANVLTCNNHSALFWQHGCMVAMLGAVLSDVLFAIDCAGYAGYAGYAAQRAEGSYCL